MGGNTVEKSSTLQDLYKALKYINNTKKYKKQEYENILKNNIQNLYTIIKEESPTLLKVNDSLPQILQDGFDIEQIWEQLCIHIDPFQKNAAKRLEYFESLEEYSSNIKEDINDIGTQDIFTDNIDTIYNKDIDNNNEEESDLKKVKKNNNKSKKVSINVDSNLKVETDTKDTIKSINNNISKVEDGFFSWDDMNQFADIDEEEDEGTEYVSFDICIYTLYNTIYYHIYHLQNGPRRRRSKRI